MGYTIIYKAMFVCVCERVWKSDSQSSQSRTRGGFEIWYMDNI